MPYTGLTDITNPTSYGQYTSELAITQSALMSSGAIIRSTALDLIAAERGNVGQLPNFATSAWTAPDIVMDDTTSATITSVGGKPQIFQKDFVSKTWGTSELADVVSGEDILDAVAQNVVAPYFAETFNQYALKKISGLLKDNAANDGGDMIKSVVNDVNSAVLDAERATFSTFADAMQTMGDARSKIALIYMNSQVYTNMVKSDSGFSAPSDTVPFITYHGIPVILDDGLAPVAGTYRPTYTTLLLGRGSIAFGEADLGEDGVALEKANLLGKGGGLKTLTVRKRFVLHPVGSASTATVAANTASPTLAAYDSASAWDRVYSRKNVPIVALKTNG
jgi:hypothetical protein